MVGVLLLAGDDDGAPEAAALRTTTAASATVTTVIEQAALAERAATSSFRRGTTTRQASAGSGGNAISSRGSATSRVRGAIRRHWSMIEAGRYEEAYALLGPNLQTSMPRWVAEHRADALSSASLTLGTPDIRSSTRASVPVLSMRTVANSGCYRWSGSYDMVRVGGVWRIDRSTLTRSAC
ncbi:hypothetical protein SK069_10885 [Patulibacter brassicae]|uniref:Nuclear transport factor 2 family protein n=1 Tax=Patulibacter brassicae TaxID=1705717 RepID=A0ABU4VKU6_9ACTN|nr:hypothetical protein [Patulibacter brassicae]MDX8152100.1 hypothetical protein [Patulibacter brassicae]